MAGYTYHGNDTIRAARERKQRLQAELEASRQALKEAQRIQRENQRIEQRIIETQNRTAQLIETPRRLPHTPLPEPRYGGPQGLLAAAAEAKQHTSQKRKSGYPKDIAA
jgi:hypothetical protein